MTLAVAMKTATPSAPYPRTTTGRAVAQHAKAGPRKRVLHDIQVRPLAAPKP
jgi:hypothetical protein